MVIILSLGVAAFLSIRLANRAAVASFQDFTQTLTGASDWIVEAPSGTLPETILPELRAACGTGPVGIAPVVETTAILGQGSLGSATNSFTLVGIDIIGIANVATLKGTGSAFAATGFANHGEAFHDATRSGPAVWVPARLADQASLSLLIDDQQVTVTVAGAIPVEPGAPSPDHLIVMDLPDLQSIAHKAGRLDRVEFVVAQGPGVKKRRADLGTLLTALGQNGERWDVRSPGARKETAETMTEAFRLNLTILSLIALLVGLYLIFQSLDGAVVRRRSEIAILRSLGVEEATVRRAWLIEAACLGFGGGIIGIGLGWLGAQGAVRAVGRTVNALYFATTVQSASLDATEVWIGLGLGTLAGIAAGWWPAREASRTPPAQILVRTGAPEPGAAIWRSPFLGLALLAVGFGLARVPVLRFTSGTRFPLAGYGAALAWIIGGGMVWASALPILGRLGRGTGKRSASTRVPWATSSTRRDVTAWRPPPCFAPSACAPGWRS